MGIDVYVFEFLLNFSGGDLGDGLCLGRQGMHIGRGSDHWLVAKELLAQRDPVLSLDELVHPSGFSETFLAFLGCRTVQSMDYSPFEGAEIICDLNQPIPKGLRQRFDFILDGGTLEHIYDIPTAIRNVKQMLRPGGLFLSVNAANNQLGHGLYQFSPELFWRAFGPESGYTIERMQLVPLSLPPTPLILDDPAGERREFGPMSAATYLMAAARRSRTAPDVDIPVFQSDYVAAWKANR